MSRILLMCLSLMFLSCSYTPKFKAGSYVKHIQSDCVGVVSYTYDSKTHKGKVELIDYICEIKHRDYKYIKRPSFIVHEDNLKYAGTPSIKKYKQAKLRFLIQDKNEEKQKLIKALEEINKFKERIKE